MLNTVRVVEGMQVVRGPGVEDREGVELVADKRINLEGLAELVVFADETDEVREGADDRHRRERSLRRTDPRGFGHARSLRRFQSALRAALCNIGKHDSRCCRHVCQRHKRKEVSFQPRKLLTWRDWFSIGPQEQNSSMSWKTSSCLLAPETGSTETLPTKETSERDLGDG